MNIVACLLVFLSCGLTLAEEDALTYIQKHSEESEFCSFNVCDIMKEFGSMKEKLEALENQLNDATNQIEELRNGETTKVVFSAAAGGSGVIGPFKSDSTFIYRTVITNIGNAYNESTGIFTAPVAGVYYFTFFYHAGGERPSTLLLYKNQKRIAASSDHASRYDGADNGGNGVTLELQEGDQVYVLMRANTHVWGDAFAHTTFSGFLLSQD